MACSTFLSLSGERVPLRCRSGDVAAIEAEIAAHEGIAALVLTVHGAPLDARSAATGAEVVVSEALVGGGKDKKKKKKNFTTPKHVSHKHKKVKLAVLKYYGLEDGKVTNLRVNCVGKCPDGVKMASHADRSHCGRCGITIFKEN